MTLTHLPRLFVTILVWLISTPVIAGAENSIEPGHIRLFKTPIAVSNFALEDFDRAPFTLEHLKQAWSLVYFGYLSCSDACPATLSALRGAYKRLAAQPPPQKVQVVFISIDPHRDTFERLKEHIQFFNPSFKGVTGNRAELARLLGQFGARFDYIDRVSRKKITDIDVQPATDDYIVGHWVDLLLFNPAGQLAGIITPPHDPQIIVDALDRLIRAP